MWLKHDFAVARYLPSGALDIEIASPIMLRLPVLTVAAGAMRAAKEEKLKLAGRLKRLAVATAGGAAHETPQRRRRHCLLAASGAR
jgi:hypothetical protein